MSDKLEEIKKAIADADKDGLLPQAFYVAVGFEDVKWMIQEIETLRKALASKASLHENEN